MPFFRSLRRLWAALQQRLDGGAAASPLARPGRALLFIAAGWMLLWTIVPALSIGNIPIDVPENVIWGRHFAFGYDKNPYFGAWLTWGVMRFCPGDWVSYLLSQLSVGLALLAVWLLGLELFRDRFRAFVAAALLLAISFFSQSATEFNDDVIELALWAHLALFACRAIKRQRLADWIAAGLFAGLALMTKYLALAIFAPLGLLLFVTPEGRASWKKPGLYLAAALLLLLALPNLRWLAEHDFIALRYAFGRADLHETVRWSDHIVRPLHMLAAAAGRMLVPALLLALCFRRSKEPAAAGFDRTFILLAALLPFTLSLFFSVVSGGKFHDSWTTPYFVFAGLLLVTLHPPEPGPRRERVFLAALGGIALATLLTFAYEHVYQQPYLARNWHFETYPGRETAEAVTRAWRRAYGRPLPFAAGHRTEACYLAYYSPDEPDAFFELDPALSPWIDPDAVRHQGGVVLWGRGSHAPDDDHAFLRTVRLVPQPPFTFRRARAGWFARLIGREPPEVVILYAFIPPEDAVIPPSNGDQP